MGNECCKKRSHLVCEIALEPKSTTRPSARDYPVPTEESIKVNTVISLETHPTKAMGKVHRLVHPPASSSAQCSKYRKAILSPSLMSRKSELVAGDCTDTGSLLPVACEAARDLKGMTVANAFQLVRREFNHPRGRLNSLPIKVRSCCRTDSVALWKTIHGGCGGELRDNGMHTQRRNGRNL